MSQAPGASWTTSGDESIAILPPAPRSGNTAAQAYGSGWWVPQTPHSTMNVVLSDGSVRSLSGSPTGATWWAAVTPNGNEVLSGNW